MKSLAKALLIIACLVCAPLRRTGWMVIADHVEVGCYILLFGAGITVFYEAQWK